MESGGVCVRSCEKYLRERQQREQGKNIYAIAESVVKAAGCRVPFTSARVQAFPGAKPGENFLKEISTHLLTVLTTGAILAS